MEADLGTAAVMAMPENILSEDPVAATMLDPDGRGRSTLLVDYELGGAGVGDPSQGLQVQVWEARVSAGVIQTRPDGVGAWTDITSDTDITEIALAFDQNMRPTVAYVAGGVAKMYWYDAVAAAYVTSTFTGATSPVVTMDDKRPMQIGLNDVLLFYLKAGRIMHRRQRDRYTIEYDLGAVPTGMTRIVRWGRTVANRVQLEFGVNGTTESAAGTFGEFYTDLTTDTLYVVDGVTVKPFLGAGTRTGLWRSRMFVMPEAPSFAWMRLNGEGPLNGTVRVYADDVLVLAEIVTGREPFRVEALRGRRWEVEYEGTGNVSSIVLASSAGELT